MIVVPFFSTWHAPLVEAALSVGGEECRVLAGAGENVVRAGLETVNNDACYAALLAAGRTVDMLRESAAVSVRPAATCPQCVAVPTPCVFCRGDDAPYLVEQALVASGLGEGVLVISSGDTLEAIAADKRATARLADAVAFGDALLQARLHMRPYVHNEELQAFDNLLATWGTRTCDALAADKFVFEEGLRAFEAALVDFGVPTHDKRPIVGIVGTASAVFDERMNAGLAECIEREGCEVALPYLLPLAAYALREKGIAAPLCVALEERCLVLQRHMKSGFRCPTVPDLECAGMKVVPRFLVQGAGWTIAGTALLLVEAGVRDLVYARAFGCLAGHVVGQGAVKPLRVQCAAGNVDVNIATIEFDPGTSEVNQVNRIKLMTTVAKRAAAQRRSTL